MNTLHGIFCRGNIQVDPGPPNRTLTDASQYLPRDTGNAPCMWQSQRRTSTKSNRMLAGNSTGNIAMGALQTGVSKNSHKVLRAMNSQYLQTLQVR